jgi:hypothetical protein
MATKGASNIRWAKISSENPSGLPSYDTVVQLSKLVSANLVFNTAEGTLYADDQLAEQEKRIVGYTNTATITDMTPANVGDITGAEISTNKNKVTINKRNNAPLGGLGYVRGGTVDGVDYFESVFCPKVKGSLPAFNATTVRQIQRFRRVLTLSAEFPLITALFHRLYAVIVRVYPLLF